MERCRSYREEVGVKYTKVATYKRCNTVSFRCYLIRLFLVWLFFLV